MKPRLCDHERERRRAAGVRRYEPADIEIPPWPAPRYEEPNSAPVQQCVADLRDYVGRHWPVARLLVQALALIVAGACGYVGVLGVGALLRAVW